MTRALSTKIFIGKKLLTWYKANARDLPFRQTKDPYKIWICEIVFQQTRIEQGLDHYQNFIKRFPDVNTLANAHLDEVLVYWQGLGYYSRAMNLHKAAQQILSEFGGEFPKNHADIMKLKGVGKYTAAAISSICFNEMRPAVDGNFYRVLSRVFADDFDISNTKAFEYFSDLSLKIIPSNEAGDFNQAMMDLGSEVCKPKNPDCVNCPLQQDCISFGTGKTKNFPVKTKKVKVKNLELDYVFIYCENLFLTKRRGTESIWKNLYEFCTNVDAKLLKKSKVHKSIQHKLTHKSLTIRFLELSLDTESELRTYASKNNYEVLEINSSQTRSFPKPLENFLLTFKKRAK